MNRISLFLSPIAICPKTINCQSNPSYFISKRTKRKNSSKFRQSTIPQYQLFGRKFLLVSLNFLIFDFLQSLSSLPKPSFPPSLEIFSPFRTRDFLDFLKLLYWFSSLFILFITSKFFRFSILSGLKISPKYLKNYGESQ